MMTFNTSPLVLAMLVSMVAAEEINTTEPAVSVSIPVIVVTGTLTEKELSESPVPVHVISQQTIAESGAIQLNELLKDVPGITTQTMHGQQGQSIMMQGMSSQYVMILVDGVPISQTSGEINTERLFLNNVERIEVVPGSSSALYGSSAMGGVVNIITRKAEHDFIRGSLSASQSETDTDNIPMQLTANIAAGKYINDLFFNSTVSLTRYAGADTTPNEYGDDIAAGYRWDLNQQITWENFSASAQWLGGRLDRPFIYSVANNRYPSTKTENSDELTLRLQHKSETNEQLLQLDYDGYETIQDINATPGEDFKREAESYGARASSNWNFNIGLHDITIGSVATWESLEQDTTTRVEVENADKKGVELFAQDDWYTTETLEIISGLRGQWDEGYNWFASPKISARWNAFTTDKTNVFVRASTGLGYRAPSLKELYYRFDHSQYGYEVIGNSSLEPEKSWSTQIELGGGFKTNTNEITWSINGFQQDISNLIVTEFDPSISNGLDTYLYQNIDEAIIKGIDTSLTVPFEFANQQVTWQSDYHYLYAKNTSSNEPLVERPTHRFNQKLRAKLASPFQPVITVQWNMTGEQYVSMEENSTPELADGYQTIDVSSLLTLNDHLSLQLGVYNLTNQYSDDTLGNAAQPTLGRTWRAAMTFQ